MDEFDPYDFLRRMEEGEFDVNLPEEVDSLSADELEQLALVITGQILAKAAENY